MAFVGFFLCPGEAAGRSHLLHAPAMHFGHLGESMPFDGKVCAFSDNVRSETSPLVEFPEDAFEAVVPVWAHSKWETFDSGLSGNHAKFSVVPTPAGLTHQLPKMIWVPHHCISLLIGHHLTLCQVCAKVLDKVHHGCTFSAKGRLHWIGLFVAACSIQDSSDDHSPILTESDVVAPVTDQWFLS